MATPEITVQSKLSAELRRDRLMALRLRRWTREEYYRMIDAGILTTQDKVQLIEGEIVEMAPQYSPHATALTLAYQVIGRDASGNHYVRIQLPLALGPDSEPEPDVAVVAGSARDYWDEHPTTALLVIEVSASSLKFDRTVKARVYARAGIPEYWIVNLDDSCVEVHRDPILGSPMRMEPCYQTVKTHGRGDRISPLAMPNESFAVDDFLR
jgi:Uma2 family endonuclease